MYPMIRHPLNQREYDKRWAWKFWLRVITFIFASVSLGCCAYVLANPRRGYRWSGYWDTLSMFVVMWPLGASVLWNLTAILTYVFSTGPIHPGAVVGLDLIIWLVLFLTGIFGTIEGVQDAEWRARNYYGDSSYGDWRTINGTDTWVPNGYGSDNEYACQPFDTCADSVKAQRQLTDRATVQLVGMAYLWLIVLLHFALFVCGCIDTHDRRAKAKTREATVIAERIISEMQARGQIRRPRATDAAAAMGRQHKSRHSKNPAPVPTTAPRNWGPPPNMQYQGQYQQGGYQYQPQKQQPWPQVHHQVPPQMQQTAPQPPQRVPPGPPMASGAGTTRAPPQLPPIITTTPSVSPPEPQKAQVEIHTPKESPPLKVSPPGSLYEEPQPTAASGAGPSTQRPVSDIAPGGIRNV
ncbi:hypothetical protein M501DRAFT_987524 [Patellaria atrata CBS 101060]|uniref:MARVEL domain-containing protein n=1 Tax=Patellaria atrata CBS 101060 TaxID=1346257 RepID=A0A9P4S634_9PEZI|nr:hypothetical protein M501DRAFT_987524 [Patellaria atrata CBS 101060]